MIHIGDNYESDFENPKKMDIEFYTFSKSNRCNARSKKTANNLTQMLMKNMPFWRDNQSAMNFIGIRTMIAVVANKYFDNPFRIFNRESDFNGDPYLIGYYAVGMYMFGVSNGY